MSSLIKELTKWKKDLEDLGVERGKAEGRLEQAMDNLKNLGYDTLESAKEELDRLVKEKQEAETQASNLLNLFKEKYADFIE